MKKNVYFIQPNFMYGNNAYLPYAAGAIAAYAWNEPKIADEYKLAGLIYKRENIQTLLESFDSPFVVGFSSYIWNFEYNKKLAKALKEKYPECIVIFGGHSIPSNSPQLLEQYDFMDFLIHDEGEIPFKELLLYFMGVNSIENISNISYRNNGEIIKSNTSITDETEYPSPYLNGIFDDIMRDKGVSFTATLETNRGCPFKCSYCDWGIYKSKLRAFPADKIKQEIHWMAENKIELCMGADSNFGVLERDTEIAQWLLDSNKKTGYPRKFRVAYTKNSDEKVFEINRALNLQGMSKGGTLSFQSLNETVLDNIGRVNITQERFRNLLTKYKAENIPTYSEIILGLPGETYETFCNGINTLLENGQHASINMYSCELLVNALMSDKGYMEKFKIKAVTTQLNQYHCEPNADDVKEFSSVVVSTDSMSNQDWVKSNCFAWAVQCFHCLGLLQSFAIYLNNEKNIKYKDFYLQLLKWLENRDSSSIGNIYKDIRRRLTEISQGNGEWEYVNKVFGNITWPFEEGTFLEFAYKFEEFYKEIEAFLRTYNIDSDVFLELMQYQKSIINIPMKEQTVYRYTYDFFGYFKNILAGEYAPLQKRQNTIEISDYSQALSWEEYATKVVWYGRKEGKNICTKIKQVWD